MAMTSSPPTSGSNGVAAAEWEDFVHTGPGTLAGRYLRRFWHPVHRAQDLAPGRAKPIRILGEDLTLYRGDAGSPHCVAFRCAHRGTQLSTGWVEGDEIRCFYHGWKYGTDGQCTEQPAEPEPFCNRIKIRAYPVEEYLGLIFAYFGEGEPPPLPRFPEFEDEADGVRFNMTYTWPCNWVNSLENDPFHGLWVHRDSYVAAGRVSIPTVTCEETDYGYATFTTRSGGHTTVSHRLWPNASYGRRTRSTPDGMESGATDLGPGVWRGAVAWRVPVDDEHFSSFDVQMTHVHGEYRARYEEMLRSVNERSKGLLPAEALGAAVLRGDYRIEDIEDRHVNGNRLFNLQDYCSQVAQGVVADRAHEHLGREDVTILLQRSIWRRELRALAEGKPLKEWARPTDALAVGETRKWV